jgi:hypothetical protein
MKPRSPKILIAWMTVVIYTMAGCAFITDGHCCSGHSHVDGEAQEDHEHLPVEPGSDRLALSEFASAPNEFSLSQRHCCGQGLHGEGERIAFHAVNCQRSAEPSRLSTWLSSSAAPCHGQADFPHAFPRVGCALSRAPARSPALESILTVSLLI